MIFENFEIALVSLGQFQNFKNLLGQLIPNCPPKHVITCTYLLSFGKRKLLSQSAITCSKLTKETLEQGVKYVQS